MALWAPETDLLVQPRLWARHRNVTWSGSAFSSMTNAGSAGGSSTGTSGTVEKGASIGGYDAIRFNSGSARVQFSVGNIPSGEIFVFAVYKLNTLKSSSTGGNGLICVDIPWASSGVAAIYPHLDDGGQMVFMSGNGWGGGTCYLWSATGGDFAAGTNWRVDGFRLGANIELHRNANDIDLTGQDMAEAATPAFNSASVYVGNVDPTYYLGGEDLRGDLVELMLFDAKPADLDELMGWAAWEYDTDTSLVSYLPSGHPYKSAAPTVGSSPVDGAVSLAATSGQSFAAQRITPAALAAMAAATEQLVAQAVRPGAVSAAATSGQSLSGTTAVTVSAYFEAAAAASFSAAGRAIRQASLGAAGASGEALAGRAIRVAILALTGVSTASFAATVESPGESMSDAATSGWAAQAVVVRQARLQSSAQSGEDLGSGFDVAGGLIVAAISGNTFRGDKLWAEALASTVDWSDTTSSDEEWSPTTSSDDGWLDA